VERVEKLDRYAANDPFNLSILDFSHIIKAATCNMDVHSATALSSDLINEHVQTYRRSSPKSIQALDPINSAASGCRTSLCAEKRPQKTAYLRQTVKGPYGYLYA
jgi:hypothetical protein